MDTGGVERWSGESGVVVGENGTARGGDIGVGGDGGGGGGESAAGKAYRRRKMDRNDFWRVRIGGTREVTEGER